MAKIEMDRGKLRARLRKLRKDDLLGLLDRAVDLVPKTRLPALVEGYLDPAELRPDGASEGGLRAAVAEFREASYRGEYHEDFAVDSKNFMEMSRGTQAWIAECERLFDCSVAAVEGRPDRAAREAFEVLLGLLRHIDEGHDDVIFFADEGGAWQVGIDWRKILPVYFKALADSAGAEEYGRAVIDAIEDFADHDRARHLRAARSAASPAQKKALRGA